MSVVSRGAISALRKALTFCCVGSSHANRREKITYHFQKGLHLRMCAHTCTHTTHTQSNQILSNSFETRSSNGKKNMSLSRKRSLIALQEKRGEHWNPPGVVRWLGAESSNMGSVRSDPRATCGVPWKVPASSHTLKSWTAVLGHTFDFLRNSHN